jgi:hypothetical protein
MTIGNKLSPRVPRYFNVHDPDQSERTGSHTNRKILTKGDVGIELKVPAKGDPGGPSSGNRPRRHLCCARVEDPAQGSGARGIRRIGGTAGQFVLGCTIVIPHGYDTVLDGETYPVGIRLHWMGRKGLTVCLDEAQFCPYTPR